MVVDTEGDDRNRIWFVTRAGIPHAYRMDFPSSLMKGNARWTSWDLRQFVLTTGGTETRSRIRPSKDLRFVFVRTLAFSPKGLLVSRLERIDTRHCTGTPQTCERVVWTDQNFAGVNAAVAILAFEVRDVVRNLARSAGPVTRAPHSV